MNFNVNNKECYFEKDIILTIYNPKIIHNYVKLSEENIKFLNEFKKDIIKKIYPFSKKIYGIQKTICCLEEFYCSPHKLIPFNNKYEDVIKINNNNNHNSEIINIHFKGLWFSDKSWGPYLSVSLEECIKKPLFIDSDSEIDF
jgi:hypothetical protein